MRPDRQPGSTSEPSPIRGDIDPVPVDDPLRRAPRTTPPRTDCRLHGPDENSHDDDCEEPDELAEGLDDPAVEHDRVYCLFDDAGTADDAAWFRERLG